MWSQKGYEVLQIFDLRRPEKKNMAHVRRTRYKIYVRIQFVYFMHASLEMNEFVSMCFQWVSFINLWGSEQVPFTREQIVYS